ncbi:MAG: hypothetical protein H8D56_16795 [Planctomycetes bacterium]|nr:hypothetical protein [Planctomycetota bacterium]MBL7142601.1 hypothetical protein [Phycisphaerae bacterium]
MSRKLILALALTLSAFVSFTSAVGQTLPPAIQWIPEDAIIVLEVTRPKALLEAFCNDEATAAITALPLYKQQASNPKVQEFFNIISFIETTLDTNWRTAIEKLTGAGITLAVCPEDTVFLIIDAEDEQMLERFHEFFINVARSEAEKKGKYNIVKSKEYDGLTAWTFDGKEAHTIIGKRLVLANKSERLKNILQNRSQTNNASVAANPAYQAAKRTVGTDAVAKVFVNLKPLMGIPQIAKIFNQQNENPLAALAFAGILEATRDSNWLALGLHIEDNTLVFRASVDSKTISATSPAAFALPKKPGEGVFPNLSVPRRIAALSFYRDLHQFYSAKDELFPERTSGLIFFENMMGIFFSGRDLTNEVLAETKPEIRFVVAEQKFDSAIGTPQIQLPAFAVILRLQNPEQFNEVAEEAWQKALGLINFTRGQQAMQGLIIDRTVHGGTKFSMAYFSTSGLDEKNNLEQRFNIRPSLAMPGEYLILSSTDDLARDLIDSLNREMKDKVKPITETHSLVEIDTAQLTSILKANRDIMVRSDMVKKGSTQEEAEAGIDLLITLVKLVGRAKLGLGTHKGLTQALLEIKLNL